MKKSPEKFLNESLADFSIEPLEEFLKGFLKIVSIYFSRNYLEEFMEGLLKE